MISHIPARCFVTLLPIHYFSTSSGMVDCSVHLMGSPPLACPQVLQRCGLGQVLHMGS